MDFSTHANGRKAAPRGRLLRHLRCIRGTHRDALAAHFAWATKRVEDNAIVFSTSTRNFNNRMGKGVQVYLGSAELAAACALLGKIPTAEEYLKVVASKIAPFESEVYRYLNFNEIKGFEDEGRVVTKEEEEKIEQEGVTTQ